MRYLKIDKCDMNNGTGIRVVLWLTGCYHDCDGCHNPETHNRYGGNLFESFTYKNLIKALDNEHIEGLTITGGDPMAYYQREEVSHLCNLVKKILPDKNIWIWTGHLLKDVIQYVEDVDVVIDGKYEKYSPTVKKWRGSDNQKLWKRTGIIWEEVK